MIGYSVTVFTDPLADGERTFTAVDPDSFESYVEFAKALIGPIATAHMEASERGDEILLLANGFVAGAKDESETTQVFMWQFHATPDELAKYKKMLTPKAI